MDDSVISITGTVRNVGERDGADVVQVYVELPDLDAPERLVGFARLDVVAGGDVRFDIVVPRDRLATRDPQAKAWRSASGTHRITVGRFAGDPQGVTFEPSI